MAAKAQDVSDDLRAVVDLDRLIHEPARMVICAILYAVKSADFLYLLRETGLTKGNLSSHLGRLEKAEYVEIEKTYDDKTPRTILSMTDTGRTAFETYRKAIKRAADQM